MQVPEKRGEALKIARELEVRWKREHFPPTTIALVYAGLKDKDQAFREYRFGMARQIL